MKLANITSKIRGKIIANTYKGVIHADMKVVDIGCGTGVVSKEINKILSIKISGCDIEKYLLITIPFKKMVSSNKLPYKSKSFETAMFNDVLHHVDYKTQEELILESLRVANETLIFEFTPSIVGKLFDFIINKIHNPKMNIPYTYRSDKEWEKLFSKLNIKYKNILFKKPRFYPFKHLVYILK